MHATDDMYSEILTQVIEKVSANWPGHFTNAVTATVRASIDLFHVIETITQKPTPSKFMNSYNPRQLYKLIYGLHDVDISYLEGILVLL
jgi:hypothetical protein